MQHWLKLAFGVALAMLGLMAAAKADDYKSLPRKDTLIVENPEGTIKNPGWFNIWVNGGGGVSTGLQQLTMATLWYIYPEKGLGGSNSWDNSLAADKPQYNADFTEMTAKLRKGLYWSDGAELHRRRPCVYGQDGDRPSRQGLTSACLLPCRWQALRRPIPIRSPSSRGSPIHASTPFSPPAGTVP